MSGHGGRQNNEPVLLGDYNHHGVAKKWRAYLAAKNFVCPAGGAHHWRLDSTGHGECVKCGERR